MVTELVEVVEVLEASVQQTAHFYRLTERIEHF